VDVERVVHTAFPLGMFEPMYRFLWGRRVQFVAPGMRKEHFGTTRDAVDLIVDVTGVQARKRASMAAHATQCGGNPDALLPVDTSPLLDEEWFVVASGVALPPNAVLPTDGLG
jgi:LmbE family N-acetylglucosaminyl deacetylase